MPVYMPVLELLYMAKIKTARILTNILRSGSAAFVDNNDDDNTMQLLQLYLSEVPVNVREGLLHYILEFEDDDSVRYMAFKIMFCPQMKTLRTFFFPDTFFKSIAKVIQLQGSQLVSLDLKGVCLNGLLNVELQKILLNLKSLQTLHIPHVATDSTLQAIGQSNPPLQILDITGECEITSVGIEQLCDRSHTNILQNLRAVLLGNPGGVDLSPQNVALLIQYLPNLQSLGAYSKVRQSIALLVKDKGLVSTNLTNLHDCSTDLESINLLIQTCPHLTYIYLEQPSDKVIPRLVHFNELNKIKLNKFQISDFYLFIESGGNRLKNIELMFGDEILDISYLMKCCSNLETLKCYNMENLKQLCPFESTKLKDIEICDSEITPSCLKKIIQASINLENISFIGYLEMKDEDIIEIFIPNKFSKLKSIWFTNALNLTSNSIDILMSCCPNLLTLGVISNWNVSEEEVNVIQREIQSKNLALDLIDNFVGE